MAVTADDRLALVNLKIERAKKHIADIDSAVSAFLGSNPYEVRSKRDPLTRKPVYYVSRVEPTPVSVATITGDAIQNLRSALDHLAYQLFLVGGTGGKGEHIYFLIERSATEYKSRFPGKVKGMRQDAIDALKAIEPYKGGKGHDLWMLHTLNNIDKHRLLVTVGSSFQSVDLGTYMGGLMGDKMRKAFGRDVPFPALFVQPADNLCPLKVGDELFIGAPDGDVNQKMNFRFGVALSEPEVGEGKPILELLVQFADRVEGIVTAFKSCLT